jgi:hypothetical protein
MFSEAISATMLRTTEVTGAVGEIVEVGLDIEELMSGSAVACPVVLRLVLMEPVVLGTSVLRGGRTCAVSEPEEVVRTETLGVTVDVVGDEMLGGAGNQVPGLWGIARAGIQAMVVQDFSPSNIVCGLKMALVLVIVDNLP